MDQAIIRVGVLGVGIMGERHARLYAQLPGVELVGVFDTDQARAQSVAARWQTAAFDSVEALLGSVDAVSIASSTASHAPLATRAIDAGAHLLVEKPVADTLTNARALARRAARRPGTTIQVGHIERFNPVVQELRQQLAGQRVLGMSLRRLSPFANRCLDTDVVHDLMIHDLDLAAAFCGEQLRLTGAHGGYRYNPQLDYATAYFAAPGDVRLTLEASRVASRKVRAMKIQTEDRWIEADLLAKTITVRQQGPGFARPILADDQPPAQITIPDVEPLRLELEYFVQCVRTGTQSLVGIEAGVRAMDRAAAITTLIAAQTVPDHGRLVAATAALAAGLE